MKLLNFTITWIDEKIAQMSQQRLAFRPAVAAIKISATEPLRPRTLNVLSNKNYQYLKLAAHRLRPKRSVFRLISVQTCLPDHGLKCSMDYLIV